MTHVRKIKSGGVNTSWQNFVGEVGILFYDQTLGNLRLSDGHTPGGVALTIDSAQAIATTSTVGSVQPDGTTIRVDQYGIISAVNPGGTGDIAFVHGTMYHTSSTAITLQPSLFSDGYVFGTDGNLIFPTGSLIRNGYPGPGGSSGTGDTWFVSSVNGGGVASPDGKNYLQADNVGLFIGTNYTTSTNNQWVFGQDGSTQFPNYTFPPAHGLSGQVLVDNGFGTLAWTTPVTTVSNLVSGTYTVSLSATGDLLPTANNLGNLGSPTQQWNALYVNTATVYIGGNALRVSSEAGITLNNQGIGVNTISAGTDTAVVGSAGTFTINSISTLQSITGRGATTNNRISITNTTTSAGYQTGALTVSGGVGIAGALNVNGTATFGSTAVFQGPVTFAASSNTSYTANLFMLHTPPDGATATWTINDGKDIGILYPYYTGTTGTTGALVLSNGSKNLEWFGSNYSTGTQVGTYGTFKTNAIILAGGTQSIDTGTGDLVISGGVGIGKNLRAAYIYSNGWAVTTTTFNTSTLVAMAVTSTYAQSFNTATLVSLAVTSTFAQSFNTGTLVNTAVNATNSLYANTATYAQSFNTATLVNTAVNATTSSYANTASYARSFNTATLVAIAVTSTFAQSFNTATLVSNAVIASGLGSNIITISNTSTAISNTSGALQVSGGVGVAGSIYANAVYSNGYAVSTSTASAITIQLNGTTLGVPTTINFATGTTASIVGNVVTVQATAVSGSATTSTLNAGTYTVALSTSGVLTIPGTLQNLLNIGSVTISASSGTNTATWTFGTAGSLAFPDGSKQLTAFTGTVVFNTATLVAQAVSANTATIAQSVVGGIGVATLTAGTGTYISTSTGAVTIWVSTASTFNTSTLVALAVTSTFAQSFNTATLVNAAINATKLINGSNSINIDSSGHLLPNSNLSQDLGSTSSQWRSLYVGTNTIFIGGTSVSVGPSGSLSVGGSVAVNSFTGTSVTGSINTSTGVVTLSFNTNTLVALAVTSTFAQSFNTATLVAQAVSATTSSYATTATFAQSFNTATLVALAVTATSLAWTNKISIGQGAGYFGSTFNNWIAVGTNAGGNATGNGDAGISIGYNSNASGSGSISLGSYSLAQTGQGNNAIAIGTDAGNKNQGNYSIAIGYGSGKNDIIGTAQAANTIILNASGSTVDGVPSQTNSTYITPIRNATTTSGILYYNTITYEVTYGSLGTLSIGSGLSGTSYNGSASVTMNIDYTIVATTSSAQTLSNKTINAGVNTISSLTNSNLSGSAGITNANLANSSITVGSTAISLGGSNTAIAGLTQVDVNNIRITGNTISATNTNGNLTISTTGTGTIVVTNTVSATSTNTGALQIYGGVGIGGNAFVGGSFTATGVIYQGLWAVSTASNVLASPYAGIFTITNTSSSISTNTGALQVVGGVGIGGQVFIGGNHSIAGITTVTNTTAAISTNTGALQVVGGVGVGGNLYVGGIVTATTFVGTANPGTTSTTASALGYLGMPQLSTATSYTLVAGDQGKHIYITATGQTITIPANTAVAFPIGSSIAFIAGPSATTVSIAITTDTMYLGGSGTTGTRTLAAYGMATAVKVAATTWFINGSGLT